MKKTRFFWETAVRLLSFKWVDKVSSYIFENHLGSIKRFVTSSHNALEAMIRGVQREQQQYLETNHVFRPPQPKICTDHPNNVYIDVHSKRCFVSYCIC